MELYVVLSRDSDFVFVTDDKIKAEYARLEQIQDEEMQGGRPSVYIRKTTLK
jgi:hypothetical protein